eukprot:2198853-Alexandrium_andersonii.AAC.1
MHSDTPEVLLPSTAVLLVEVLKLGWPQRWVAATLKAIPQRHCSRYFAAVRRLGEMLKRPGAAVALRAFACAYGEP